MLIFKHAVGVDAEGCGDGGDTEPGGNFAIEAAVAHLVPGHIVPGNKGLPRLFIVVETDADDHKWLAFKLVRDALNVGERFAAGTAPGGPEVDEYDFAGEAIHGDFAAVQSGCGEGRRHGCAGKFDAVDESLGTIMEGRIAVIFVEKLGELGTGRVVLVELGERDAPVKTGARESWIEFESGLELGAAFDERRLLFLPLFFGGFRLQSHAKKEMRLRLLLIGLRDRDHVACDVDRVLEGLDLDGKAVGTTETLPALAAILLVGFAKLLERLVVGAPFFPREGVLVGLARFGVGWAGGLG